jgi:hypothetical protein
VTIIIAAYAAVIATLGVAWQIYSWYRTHKTKVRVRIALGYMTLPRMPVVTVSAHNDNDHPIRVTGWGIEANDGSGRQLFALQPIQGSTLPGPVAAHDCGDGYQDWNELRTLPQIDFTRPVVAFANLATGERFRSKPTRLLTA